MTLTSVAVLLPVLAFTWIWGYLYAERFTQRHRVAYWLVTVVTLAGAAAFIATPPNRP